VRTMLGPSQAGLNRVWWDLRFTPTKPIRLRTSPLYAPEFTMGPDGFRPPSSGTPIALLAPPGTYTVKLTVDGKDYTQPIKVLKDPHSNGSEGDIQIQTKLLTSLSGQMGNLIDAVNQMESLRAQVGQVKGALAGDAAAAPLRAAADDLAAKVIAIEEKVIRLNATGRGQDTVRTTPELIEKIGYLATEVESSDYQPTTQQVAVHDELKEQAATYLQRLKLLLEKEVAGFNTMLRQRNVPNVVP
jgi:hypothetical protein